MTGWKGTARKSSLSRPSGCSIFFTQCPIVLECHEFARPTQARQPAVSSASCRASGRDEVLETALGRGGLAGSRPFQLVTTARA
jgi:hypothetical protein